MSVLRDFLSSRMLNQVQECKVNIEKKSRGRTSRSEKKSGSRMPREDYGIREGKITSWMKRRKQEVRKHEKVVQDI